MLGTALLLTGQQYNSLCTLVLLRAISMYKKLHSVSLSVSQCVRFVLPLLKMFVRMHHIGSKQSETLHAGNE